MGPLCWTTSWIAHVQAQGHPRSPWRVHSSAQRGAEACSVSHSQQGTGLDLSTGPALTPSTGPALTPSPVLRPLNPTLNSGFRLGVRQGGVGWPRLPTAVWRFWDQCCRSRGPACTWAALGPCQALVGRQRTGRLRLLSWDGVLAVVCLHLKGAVPFGWRPLRVPGSSSHLRVS